MVFIRKSVVALLSLIKGMASSINVIPAHREAFIAIIENIILTYYESCESKLNGDSYALIL
jgi:hypothetical protein